MHSDEKIKEKKSKSRLELVPPRALMLVGDVLAFGAEKYEPWGWCNGAFSSEDYRAAALRHLYQHALDDTDEETQMLHMAQAAASVLIALELYLMENNRDA